MLEQDLNAKAQELIKQVGGYVVKTIANNRAGVHDILACINGRFCSLEGKLPNNQMSRLQKSHQIEVIEAGGLALEFKTLQDVLVIIQWALDGYIQPLPKDTTKTFDL